MIRRCKYKYLGTLITNNGKIDRDIERKVEMGRRATRALHGVIWNKHINKNTKKRIFQSIIETITTYGSEMWPMTQKIRDKIRTVELAYMRRCLQLTRKDRVRTEEIWREMNITTSITSKFERKALRWYGHVQ